MFDLEIYLTASICQLWMFSSDPSDFIPVQSRGYSVRLWYHSATRTCANIAGGGEASRNAVPDEGQNGECQSNGL